MSRAAEVPLPQGRVALLFTDVQGSTALLHQLGDRFGDVLDEHDRILRGVWEEFGGVEVDNEGDAFFVAFVDHPRAVDAVTAAQQRLAAASWPEGVELLVRMGLHSGTPAIRGRKYWGVDVHYAARLGSAAHGGQVLLSADMRSQVPSVPVESLGSHGLKDFQSARQLFHLSVDGSVAADFPPPRTLGLARSNLPTVDTPIIGRDDILADLRTRLSGADHLVTLVGPGGIGKTRTALAAAESLRQEFSDGTGFVALASLRDAAEVPDAIATAIEEDLQGVDATTALAEHLSTRSLLLVLDNAEHLTGFGAVLAPLIASSPGTRWLVTSQEPLGLRGETQVRLEALAVPTGEEQDVASVAAAALFLDRARARRPGYVVAAKEMALLARLCHELEGIPLAVELAAARAPVLGLERLVSALAAEPDLALGQGSVDLPDRQRGLRAALDWTVSLLTAIEVDVYACGGAFAEAWSIDDVEFMVAERAGAVEVWDALARLIDLALVVQRGDGRFTMPERVRRHATRLLEARTDGFILRRRHADLVLATLGRLAQGEKLFRFRPAMAELEDHLPEVQRALTWASTQDEDCYRLLLGTCGWVLAWFGKMGPWLDDLVRFARAPDPGDLAQGRVWVFAGTSFSAVEDDGERQRWLWAALARFMELRDHAWVCETYMSLFEASCQAGDVDAGMRALREGRAYAEHHALPGYSSLIDDCGAMALISMNRFAEAERIVRQWLDEPDPANWARSAVATVLADCLWGQGRYREAARWYAEDLRGMPRSEFGNAMLQVLGIAVCCAGVEEDELAVELASGCDQLVSRLFLNRNVSIQPDGVNEALSAAAGRLPPDVIARARARGEQFDFDAVVQRALQVGDLVAAG